MYNPVMKMYLCVHGIMDDTYDIAGFAVSFLLHSIKRLSSELRAAGHACKAVHMEYLVHGSTTCTLTHNILTTACTSTCYKENLYKNLYTFYLYSTLQNVALLQSTFTFILAVVTLVKRTKYKKIYKFQFFSIIQFSQ